MKMSVFDYQKEAHILEYYKDGAERCRTHDNDVIRDLIFSGYLKYGVTKKLVQTLKTTTAGVQYHQWICDKGLNTECEEQGLPLRTMRDSSGLTINFTELRPHSIVAGIKFYDDRHKSTHVCMLSKKNIEEMIMILQEEVNTMDYMSDIEIKK